MNMEIIEISESNYQDYTNLDIVAFSFAYEGAMGEMGAIYIISRDGKIYHANYCQSDDPIDTNHINDIIPVFKDISWRMFDCLSNNPDWRTIDLFAGTAKYSSTGLALCWACFERKATNLQCAIYGSLEKLREGKIRPSTYTCTQKV